MTKDLGIWAYQDCALILIDYQKEMFETIRSETRADLAELNVRLLARTAKSFDMPIVLSTVGVAYNINGPTRPAIAAELPALEPIDRTSMNAFERSTLSRSRCENREEATHCWRAAYRNLSCVLRWFMRSRMDMK